MATVTVSNQFKYEKGLGNVDFSSDTFKIALMANGYTFDEDAHGVWADVSASEISTTGGYTAGGEALTVESAWVQDDTDDQADISWSDHTFTASGAAFDAISGAIIYDDTHASDLIVGAIMFDSDISVSDGNSLQLQDLGFDDV